jgi:hypothetical protein
MIWYFIVGQGGNPVTRKSNFVAPYARAGNEELKAS